MGWAVPSSRAAVPWGSDIASAPAGSSPAVPTAPGHANSVVFMIFSRPGPCVRAPRVCTCAHGGPAESKPLAAKMKPCHLLGSSAVLSPPRRCRCSAHPFPLHWKRSRDRIAGLLGLWKGLWRDEVIPKFFFWPVFWGRRQEGLSLQHAGVGGYTPLPAPGLVQLWACTLASLEGGTKNQPKI